MGLAGDVFRGAIDDIPDQLGKSSLNDMPGVPNGYHAYEVVKDLDAKLGYIAPAFGQPSSGLQILLDDSLLASGDHVDVQWLPDDGFLRDLTGALR